jgi:hypothetical protein
VPVTEEIVTALLDRLGDPDPGVLQQVAWSLSSCGKELVPRIAELLERSEDPAVRRGCLDVFISFFKEARPARDAIVDCLHDPDLLVRAQAANTLGVVTGELDLVVPVLVEALRAADSTEKARICRWLTETIWVYSYEEWEQEAAPLAAVVLRLYLESRGDLLLAVREAFFHKNFDDFPDAKRALEIEACLTSLREERKAREEARESGLSGHRMPMASGTFSGGRLYPWAAARNLGRLRARDPEALELLRWAAGSKDPILADWAQEDLDKIREKR